MNRRDRFWITCSGWRWFRLQSAQLQPQAAQSLALQLQAAQLQPQAAQSQALL